jgi:hypothetical protein
MLGGFTKQMLHSNGRSLAVLVVGLTMGSVSVAEVEVEVEAEEGVGVWSS